MIGDGRGPVEGAGAATSHGERSPGLLHRVGEEVRVHADAPEPIKAAEIVFRRRATSAPSA